MLFLIRLAFNKLEISESELLVIDGDSLKFSDPISIMGLYARNISLALRLISTIALIFSVCARGLCVCMLGGGVKEAKKLEENDNAVSSQR